LKADPAYDAPLFNLGLIASLGNDQAEAKKQWDVYLKRDPDSVWAKEIYLKLGTGQVPQSVPATSEKTAESLLGVTTDNYDDEISADWGAPVKKKSLLGGEDGLVLKIFANGILVVSENSQIIRLSATPPFKGKTAAGLALGASPKEMIALYGRPATTLPSTQGEAWAYPARGIAFVLVDGKVVSWILFKPV
jgi:hypothetical protein